MAMFTSGVSHSLRDIRGAQEASARLGRQLMSGKKLEALPGSIMDEVLAKLATIFES